MDWLIDLLRPISFRGKARLLAPLTPQIGKRVTSVFGYRLPLDLKNYVDRTIYLGCFEPVNSLRFRRILRQGMTVVDVGANIGYFTLLAASLVGRKGRVIAIEPHPTNFSILSEVVRTNGLGQVQPLAFGLGDVKSRAEISMADQALFPNRTASMVPPKSDTSFSVEVRTLDDCVSEWGIETIDLLKIDVDGFESKIIAGAKRSLENGTIKNVIVEFNEFWLRTTGGSPDMLRAAIEQTGLLDVTERSRFAELFLGKTEDRHFARVTK